MPESFADIEAFKARHGDVHEGEHALVETLLVDASALIRDQLAGANRDWIPADAEIEVPRAVETVTVAVAYRAWTNPDAVSREGLADVAVSYSTGGPDAIYLTKRERRTVRRAAGLGSFASLTLTSPFSGPREPSALDFH